MSRLVILRDRRLVIVLAAAAAFLAVRYSGLGDLLTIETLKTHRTVLVDWVSTHVLLAAAAYVATYIVAVAFSVPGATFLTLSGGFLFDALFGTALTVVGATIGATLIFLFAKILFGESALDRLGDRATRLAANIRANASSYLLMLRFVPLFPFFLVNLVPAFAGVRLSTYVITTLVGIIPGTTVFSLYGAGLGRLLDEGKPISPASVLTPEIVLGLIGLGILSLAAIPARKWLERRSAMAPGAQES